MSAGENEERSAPLQGRDLVLDTSASVVGAIAGLSVGGPVGAIAGAAIPPVLVAAVSKFGDRWHQARLATTVEALEIAGELMNVSPDAVLNTAVTEDERLFAGRLLNAAGLTVNRDKIRTLGRLLAHGLLGDEAVLDEVTLLADALSDLEAPHIRTLALFNTPTSSYRDAEPSWEYTVHRIRTWTWDGLNQALPTFGHGLHNVLSTLERHGLVSKLEHDLAKFYKEIGKSLSSGHSPYLRDLEPWWKLTSLGLRLLELLDEAVTR